MTDNFVTCSIAILSAIVIFCFIILGKQEEQWEKFKIEHNCKVIRQISGRSFFGPTFVNGKVGMASVYTPSRKVWKCDDGMEYER